jgi:V8-like Glu-specific endopeptidase
VTTAEWTESRDNRHRDVAFIQVDRAFEGDLRLFNFKGTPKEGHFMLGVVGYPGDKSLETDAGEERGAEMYEMFHGQEYSLDAPGNPLHLLEHDISTYGGQSGAPVIRKDSKNMIAIGTHVYAFKTPCKS